MLFFLPATVLGLISSILFALNLLFCFILFFIVIFLRGLLRSEWFHKLTIPYFVWMGSLWILGNKLIIRLVHRIDWDIQGLETLPKKPSWIMVLANHQSWVDILVLQTLLIGKSPFLKFYLKESLRNVPILGQAWVSLDFPFMKRYSREFLEKHPEYKGKDLESIRESCEKFKVMPTSIMIFLEGTRFSTRKHTNQSSPYRFLLKPKLGGFACALSEMKEHLEGLLNITIVYSPRKVTMWDLFSGKIKKIVFRAEFIPIPREMMEGRFETDEDYRHQLGSWVNEMWNQKDKTYESIAKTIFTPEEMDEP